MAETDESFLPALGVAGRRQPHLKLVPEDAVMVCRDLS